MKKLFKAAMGLAAATSIVLSTAVPANATHFSDIANSPYANEIEELANDGVIQGYSDGTFRPLLEVDRDAMSAYLYRMAGSPAYTPPAVSPFSDVSTTQAHYKTMAWMYEKGISTGWVMSDGTRQYRPFNSTNRDAMAAFLYRHANKPAYTPPATSQYIDITPTTQFYKEMHWTKSQSIDAGTTTHADGTKSYNPFTPLTREETAGVLHDYKYRMPEATTPPAPAYQAPPQKATGFGTPWQWQLSGGVPTPITGVDIYGYDKDEAKWDSTKHNALANKYRICYISAGTAEHWRDDYSAFPASVKLAPMADWPDEDWLNIKQISTLQPIMEDRVQECAQLGFDAVEFDNTDVYAQDDNGDGANDTGVEFTAQEQITYNKMLAKLAHDNGMAAGLKNTTGLLTELEPSFEFAINEECFVYEQWGECSNYAPFLNNNKLVLNVEYVNSPMTEAQRCAKAQELDISTMKKDINVGAARDVC